MLSVCKMVQDYEHVVGELYKVYYFIFVQNSFLR